MTAGWNGMLIGLLLAGTNDDCRLNDLLNGVLHVIRLRIPQTFACFVLSVRSTRSLLASRHFGRGLPGSVDLRLYPSTTPTWYIFGDKVVGTTLDNCAPTATLSAGKPPLEL